MRVEFSIMGDEFRVFSVRIASIGLRLPASKLQEPPPSSEPFSARRSASLRNPSSKARFGELMISSASGLRSSLPGSNSRSLHWNISRLRIPVSHAARTSSRASPPCLLHPSESAAIASLSDPAGSRSQRAANWDSVSGVQCCLGARLEFMLPFAR